MSRRIALWLGIVLLALAGALVVLPARWLMRALPAHWPLDIVAAHGTIWSGSASLAIGNGSNQRTLPDPLRWHWSFGNGPQLHIEHPWFSTPLIVAPTLAGVKISSQTLRLPAQSLATLDARIAALEPAGQIVLNWPRLILGTQARPVGTPLLNAEWRAAGSSLTPIRPIGHYRVELRQAAGGAAALVLDTAEGPLMLTGEGLLDARGHFHFDGRAYADPAAGSTVQAALADILNALGPRRNDQTLLQYR